MKTVFSIFILLLALITFAQDPQNDDKDREVIDRSTQITVEVEVLKCYVGTYVLHTDTVRMVVEIIVKEDRLFYNEKRGERTFESQLHPSSSNTFFFKENEAIVRFEPSDNCSAPSFDISINGSSFKCLRKE